MNFIQRFTGHLRTVNHHRFMVMKYCFKVGLYKQGLTHDLSKYSPTEFIPGVRYFQGNRSPNNAQREAEGCSGAWLHHKGRNRHHFEYWIDYPAGDADSIALCGMLIPKKYVVEMFCDRIAASRTYNKEKYTDSDPLNYYLRGKDHYVMNRESQKLLYTLLKMLSEKGEEETFKYIREHVLNKTK